MIPTVLPTYNRAPLAFVKGEGSWLIAADGSRYLDLGAGIAVNALGHANPDDAWGTENVHVWSAPRDGSRAAADLVPGLDRMCEDVTISDTRSFHGAVTPPALRVQ